MGDDGQALLAMGEARLWAIAQAVLIAGVGLVLARLAGGLSDRLARERLGAHHALILRRFISYGIGAIFVMAALQSLGLQLGVLLGAAGVLTVAIGFASQTAASNLVSGLFLLGERPFSVGEVIRVGATTGEVLSVDLLSVSLRTFDNLLVRIPNEVMMKSELTNLTRFPIRRLDLKLNVAYKEDLARVQELLVEVADGLPICLEDPRPLVIVLGFGESGIDIQLSVWGARARFLELRNAIHTEVKAALDRAGIEIPFPHRSLYAGSATTAIPVRIVEGTEQAAS